MSAIITDQFRIINCENLVNSIGSTNSSYYTFVGLTNPEDYSPDWDNLPESPVDSFNYSNDIWDTMVTLKKINFSDDVRRVVRKIKWTSGTTYDMYRNDVSRESDKQSKPSGQTSLYSSNFYVINKDFRVYICLNNGTNPDNKTGRPSLDEPTFTDLDPRTPGDSGDGYIWKYLYTINPSEVVKFDSLNYIPVPLDWNSSEYSLVRDYAGTSGQLKIITIESRGSALGAPRTYAGIDIIGDGTGGKATVVVGEDSAVESVTVTSGGSGYTFGSLDLLSGGLVLGSGSVKPVFNVIIPPPGGHGSDIYRELGANNILIYSRIENDVLNPDFVVGNKVSRIGIVKNPTKNFSSEFLSEDKVSSVYALKLVGITNKNDFENATFADNQIITQTIGLGVTAVGRVVYYDNATGVLKYWQDRALVGFNTSSLDLAPETPEYGYKLNRFTSSPESGGSLQISGGSINLQIDSGFTGITTVINNNTTYNLGQKFDSGISQPEVEKYSGDIIYIDNRPSIVRSANQKEDIKVILQF